MKTASEHFGPTFLLQSLNNFWVIDYILQPVYVFILYTNEAKLWVLTGNTLLTATRKRKIVQFRDVSDKNEHFHLQSRPCANVWTEAKRSKQITLIRVSW